VWLTPHPRDLIQPEGERDNAVNSLLIVGCEQALDYAGLSDTGSEGVVVTEATGGLCAKYVFHLSIRKYSPKSNCMKVCNSQILFYYFCCISIISVLKINFILIPNSVNEIEFLF